MNDREEGGAGVGGKEMAERGSSSRKRGKGVKWRQVFSDKPYNPHLSFFYSSSLLQQWSTESSENEPKNRHLLATSLFLFYLLLLALIQPPYSSDLIFSTKLHPFPFIPCSFPWSPPCAFCPLLRDHLALWFEIV